MKIVTNKNKLKRPCEPCETVEEGLEIGNKLVQTLEESKGIGLAANQVGISKRVCVIKVNDDPMILVNPRVKKVSDERVAYIERCLSLPGKACRTVRHLKVSIDCDNFENTLEFGPESDDLNQDNFWQDKGLLKCVCVQHEIDHLDGILMNDLAVRFEPPKKKTIKIGRNQNVMIQKDGETKFLKYKKAENFIKDGWEII